MKNYTAPELYCDEYVADTMIASACETGNCLNTDQSVPGLCYIDCSNVSYSTAVSLGYANYCNNITGAGC